MFEKFLARTVWSGMFLCLLGIPVGCGPSEPAPSSAEPAAKGAAVAACEARLAAATREIEDLRKKQRDELKESAHRLAEEEEALQKTLKEIRLEGTDLERRIRSLEAENLRMSNEAVVAIGNLKARLRAGARAPAGGGASVDRPCGACRGQGWVSHDETCKACDGQGQFQKTSSILRRTGTYSTSTSYDRCANCKGRGKIVVKEACDKCGGRGRIALGERK